MNNIKTNNYRSQIIAILSAAKLPVGDLPDDLENFIVHTEKDQLTGVAGLEVYGQYGLLRSLAVSPPYQNKGIANNLLLKIEELASRKNITTLYLLTETASAYLSKKGYHEITRIAAPMEIQRSSEFSHVCPQSAIVMKKTIDSL